MTRAQPQPPADGATGAAAVGNHLADQADGAEAADSPPRLLADARSNANLRPPFDWLTSRRMHNVARYDPTLIHDNTRTERDAQVDCPINDIRDNDKSPTTGGERFASSTSDPELCSHPDSHPAGYR